MKDLYFVDDDEKRHGPFSVEELAEFPLHAGTLVWREGMAEWRPLGDVPELRGVLLRATAQAEPVGVGPPPLPEERARTASTVGAVPAHPGDWGVAPPVAVSATPPGSTAGIVALVLAALGLGAWCTPLWVFAAFALSLAAAVVAIAALMQNRRTGAGSGMAIAGLVIGLLNLLLSGVMLFVIGLFVTADARRSAASPMPRPAPAVPATIPVMPNFDIKQPKFPTSFPGVRAQPQKSQATQPSN